MAGLLDFAARFGTEERCIEHLAGLRWPGGFVCSGCRGRVAWRLKARRRRNYAPQHRERMAEALRAQQREIIAGAVVLGLFAVGGSHQAAHRQIKSRRTILPLVVTVRDEGSDAVSHVIVTQYMRDDLVDRGVPAPALFVCHAASIAET